MTLRVRLVIGVVATLVLAGATFLLTDRHKVPSQQPIAPGTGLVAIRLQSSTAGSNCVRRKIDVLDDKALFACLDEELSSEGRNDARRALDDLRSLKESGDQRFVDQCHDLAHAVGQGAGSAMGVQALELDPGDLCQYGYLHGVFQAASGSETIAQLASDVAKMCTDRTARWESECAHGAGHGAARVVDTPTRALEVCADLKDGLDQQCAGGVFMEYGVRHRAGDSMATVGEVKPVTGDVARYPCRGVEPRYLATCHERLALLWGPELRTNADFAARCEDPNEVLAQYTQQCARSLGEWVVAGAGAFNGEELAKECSLVADDLVEGCVYGVLRNIRSFQVAAGEPFNDLCSYLAEKHQAQCLIDDAVLRDDAAAA